MTSLESFTSGRPIAVDFTAIERELASLWKSASVDHPAADGRPAVTRACQLNLVVLCLSDEEAARATGILAPVMQDCPARVLMTIAEEGAAGLSATISAHCIFLPRGGAGRQVCCEQVTLRATGEGASHLQGAVLPLLLADLPVVVWWPGDADTGGAASDAAEAHLRLARLADRLVIDSRRLARPALAWRDLAGRARPLADLSWMRLAAWRELTAAVFDGPGMSDCPGKLSRVRVTHAGEAGRSAEATLLACWVASRLGWRPAGRVGSRFVLERPGGSRGEISIEGTGETGGDGPVKGLRLEGEGLSLRLCRGEPSDTLTATVDLPGTCSLPRAIRSVERDEPTLLCRALQWGAGGDPLYDDVLRFACAMGALPPDEERR